MTMVPDQKGYPEKLLTYSEAWTIDAAPWRSYSQASMERPCSVCAPW